MSDIAAPRLLLTVAQACHALGICRRTLYQLTAPRGPIVPVYIGTSPRYAVAELERYIAAQQAAAMEAAR